MKIKVRKETLADIAAIRAVNQAAFAQAQEADQVAKLRKNCRDLLSPLAIAEGRVVGHVLFSPVVISGGSGPDRRGGS